METLREIEQQPSMWTKTLEIIDAHRDDFLEFIKPLGSSGDYDVFLIGAGSSEYVGNAIVHGLAPFYKNRIYSVPSTELVPYPSSWIDSKRKVLAIHFGRSGNSPESIQALKAFDRYHPEAYHLSITCNPHGQLSNIQTMVKHAFVITLPKETHDLGFAMTSSYTSMTLAAFYLLYPAFSTLQLQSWIDCVQQNMDHYKVLAQEWVNHFKYNRLVFLGGGELKGFAQESALKSLELSSGKVATLFDSPMGFRHGPKSFLNEETLIVFYARHDKEGLRYEMDVMNEIQSSKRNSKMIVLGNQSFGINDHLESYHPVLIGLGRMPFAHYLALFKSIDLGINPDSPSADNEVNRVVEGVILYPYGDQE